MSENNADGGYLKNLEVLEQTAEELREMESVDLDELIPKVDKALAAFRACKKRIEAVEALLAERRGETEGQG